MFFDVKVYFHLILSWYYPYEFVFCPFIYNENKLCLGNIFNFFPQKIFSFFFGTLFCSSSFGRMFGAQRGSGVGGEAGGEGERKRGFGEEGEREENGRVGLEDGKERERGKRRKGGEGRVVVKED